MWESWSFRGNHNFSTQQATTQLINSSFEFTKAHLLFHDFFSLSNSVNLRVSVQGVKSLGAHFACLCRGFDFYEVKKKYYCFSRRKGKYFYTFNNFYSEKSSKKSKIAQIYYYEPQSAGLNVQSPQSESTPRRLTLVNLQH